MRPPDFLATTRQLQKVPEFREHYDNLSELIPEPTECDIRLAGTWRCYKVMIGIYAVSPHAIELYLWASSDEARLRIGQHRDTRGRINVTLGTIKFDAALGTFVEPI